MFGKIGNYGETLPTLSIGEGLKIILDRSYKIKPHLSMRFNLILLKPLSAGEGFGERLVPVGIQTNNLINRVVVAVFHFLVVNTIYRYKIAHSA